MYIRLFALKLDGELPPDTVETLLVAADSETKKKYYSYTARQSAQTSLVGNVLARFAVSRVAGVSMRETEIVRDERGKPYVGGRSDIFVSISHSKSVCLCAVSDSPVGVDVEEIKPNFSEKIVQRFFTASEQQRVSAASHETRAKECFTVWTQKESFVKCTGEGLQAIGSQRCSGYELQSFVLFDEYAASVCIFTE